MAMTKDILRRAALARRDGLSEDIRIEAAFALADLVPSDLPVTDRTIAAYWPIGSEIDPRPLMNALAARGASLALPVIEDGSMAFRRLTRESALVSQGFATFGPSPDSPLVEPNIVLVPLAAFDQKGNRIGYGKGFYDKTLSGFAARPFLIGLAFCAQEVEDIPAEAHDIPLDAVLTEKHYRKFP